MTKTRIAIVGATGRMGKSIYSVAKNDADIAVTVATVSPQSVLQGQDYGLALGLPANGITLQSTLLPSFDVLIDFSTPKATLEHVDFCVHHNKAMVIGTPGLDESIHVELRRAGTQIPIFWSPNMSIGIYVLGELVKAATKYLSGITDLPVDIDIHEVHHHNKKDAPSGTALKLGAIIADELGLDLKKQRFDALQDGPRPENAIGFSALRTGGAIGEHSVVFGLAHEQITLSHTVSAREIFAAGAVKIALWLTNQPLGYYSMQDFVAGYTR